MKHRQTQERGTITAFVAVIATALIMVAGMAYDGGEVIAAQASVRSDAAKAARAGAQQIDLIHLRLTGETRLDPAAARSAANSFLDRVGATGQATVNGASITVTVSKVQPMQILPLPDRTVAVTETATAVDEVTP